MNADGSGQRNADAQPGGRQRSAWSPDGQKIAFRSDRDGNSEIYVMNADGSGQRNLTHNAARDGDPAWSPDGRKIAFDQRPRRQLRDLRHERRRQRAAEPDAQPGGRRPSCLVAQTLEIARDRLPTFAHRTVGENVGVGVLGQVTPANPRT